MLLASLTIAFSSCSNQKVDILDFYFPLKSIETYQVYEYEKRIYSKKEDVVEASYVRIGKIDSDNFYFVTIDDTLGILDSAVMQIVDGGIYVNQLFLYDDGTYIQGSENQQILYPSKVGVKDVYTMEHTFPSLVINNLRTHAHTDFEYRIKGITDTSLIVAMRTKTSLNSLETDSKFSFVETATILNKKGLGMYSESMKGDEFDSYKKFIKVWEPGPWESYMSLKSGDTATVN